MAAAACRYWPGMESNVASEVWSTITPTSGMGVSPGVSVNILVGVRVSVETMNVGVGVAVLVGVAGFSVSVSEGAAVTVGVCNACEGCMVAVWLNSFGDVVAVVG